MKIERIQLIQFKGFSDYTIDFLPFTVLVGLNSSGKTSVLHAIQLMYDIFTFAFGRYADPKSNTPTFVNIQWDSNPLNAIKKITLGDSEALWLNKKTTTPCELKFILTGKVALSLRVSAVNSYQIDIAVDGQSIKNQMSDPKNQQIVADIFLMNPVYMPPPAMISPRENLINFDEMQEKKNNGRLSEYWRSNLFWLYNDGNRDEFDEVIATVNKYIPGSIVRRPQLTHDAPPSVLIQFEEESVLYDINASGGGLRTLLSIVVCLRFSSSGMLLFDEPDTHFHSTLQRQIAKILWDHVSDNDLQIIVTSHAGDFIAEVPLESLRWIDRKKQKSESVGEIGTALNELGVITKVDALRALGSNKIILMEGDIDKSVLSQFAKNYSAARLTFKNPFSDSTVIVAKLPNGKSSRVHIETFKQILKDAFKVEVSIACIVDNDYELRDVLDEQTKTIPDLVFETLQRKEIENYLLVPSTIEKAVILLAQRRGQHVGHAVSHPNEQEIYDQIENILDSREIIDIVKCQVIPKYQAKLGREMDFSTKYTMGEQWFEQQWSNKDWRWHNCPGKNVLRKLRAWIKNQYSITITDGKLIEALDDCPPDISNILDKITDCFYPS